MKKNEKIIKVKISIKKEKLKEKLFLRKRVNYFKNDM